MNNNSILNSKVDSELIVREFTNEILNIAHLSIDSIRRLENDVLARCFKKRMQSNSYEEYKIGDTIFDVIARSKDTQKYEKLSLLIDRADKLFSQGGKEALINLSEGIHFLDRVKINVLLELQLRANFKVALSRNDCKFENGQLISVAPHLPKMRIIPSSKLSETKERRNVSVRQILPAPVAEKNNQPSFPITPPVRLIRVLPRQEIPVGTITTTISTQLPVFENRNAVQPCANQTYPLIPTPIRYPQPTEVTRTPILVSFPLSVLNSIPKVREPNSFDFGSDDEGEIHDFDQLIPFPIGPERKRTLEEDANEKNLSAVKKKPKPNEESLTPLTPLNSSSHSSSSEVNSSNSEEEDFEEIN